MLTEDEDEDVWLLDDDLERISMGKGKKLASGITTHVVELLLDQEELDCELKLLVLEVV